MTLAVAHRGLSSEFAENTLPAFIAAAEAGAAGIELDVRLSLDKQVVVIHDAAIDRTTDGNGRVADMKYKEIASYHTGDGPVPLLDDVLEALHDWEGHWNIELKHWRVAAPVLEMLHDHGMTERAMVSSMDPRAIKEASEHDDVERALVVLGPPDAEDRAEAKDLGCRWINVEHDFLQKPLVSALHKEGFLVGAWTVNDTGRARELMLQRVDAIITDERSVLDVVQIEGKEGIEG